MQVFIVDVRSNKRQIKEAVARLYDIQTQKINTLIRYDKSKGVQAQNWAGELGRVLNLEAAACFAVRHRLPLSVHGSQFDAKLV